MKIGNLVNILGGGTPSRKIEEYWNGNIPWISVKDFKSNKISNSIERITQKGLENSSAKLISKGNIIIPTRMALGKVAINEIDVAINQDLKALIIKKPNEVKLEYLLYFLISQAGYLESMGKGATVKGITIDILTNLDINLPPISQQEHIVQVLKQSETIIEKRKSQIKKLSLLIESVFLDMFGDPFINNRNWDVCKIGDICEIYNGSTPRSTVPEYWNGEINWATPTDLEAEGNYYIYGTERKITEEGLKKTNLKLLPRGTVLLTSRAPIGKVAIAGVELCTNQGFKNLICNDKVNNVYLYQYLTFHNKTLNNMGRGATFKEISKGIVSDFDIPLPPIELQKKYSEVLEEIESQKVLLQNSLTHLENNFQVLMHKAFNGELISE